jgi:hypothetical protein
VHFHVAGAGVAVLDVEEVGAAVAGGTGVVLVRAGWGFVDWIGVLDGKLSEGGAV